MRIMHTVRALIGHLISLLHAVFPNRSRFAVRNVPVEPLVDNVIVAFATTVAGIQFEALQMRSTALRLFRTLRKDLEQTCEQGIAQPAPQLQAWMTCLRPIDLAEDRALVIAAPGKSATDAECLTEIAHGLNAQHNWLLVSVFEAYERFYKDLYAVIGYIDPNLWKLKHLAGMTPHQATTYDLDRYSHIVRERLASRDIRELHNAIRQSFPRFAQRELQNPLGDMKLRCAVAGALRHVIVHSGGQVRHEDRLWKNVEQLTGYSLHGQDDTTQRRKYELAQFLRAENGIPEVWTIRLQNMKEPYHGIESPFMRLFDGLVNHAFLAYRVVAEHFQVLPYWLRRSGT